MRAFFSAVFAVVVGAMLSAQGSPSTLTTPQSGPDLLGRWNRDAASASPGSADSAGWGSRIEITQVGANVTVQPSPGKPSRFRLDGKETAEALSVDGCKNTVRITKAVTNRDLVTITTWIVEKSGCVHREDEDDPLVNSIGVVDVEKVRGRRKLESITAVYREGSTLTVETTRASLGGEAMTTTTTYRLAEMVEAEEARACGFVEAVLPAAEIGTKAEAMCRRLIGHAPITMRASKEAMRRVTMANLPDGSDLIRACYGSADFKEGMSAFLAKRKPEWTGR